MIRCPLTTPILALIVLVMVSGAAGSAPADPSRTLAQLCDDYWQGHLKANPTSATALGDHRYDAMLEDISPTGIERDRKRLERVLAAARTIREYPLSAADRVSRSALILEAQNGIDGIDCHAEDWTVDPLGGPQVQFMNLPDITTISTPAHAADYVRRCRAMGPYLDQHIANLRPGLAAGRVAPHDPARKVLDEGDSLMGRSPEQWALAQPLATPRDAWPEPARATFRKNLIAAIGEVVKPAFGRYREFLRTEVMPKARPQEKAGLSYLPGGADCYRKQIRIQTSLDMAPEAIHQLGLAEVAKVRAYLAELAARALGTRDIAEIQRRLRTDPTTHFSNAAKGQAKARDALARAQTATSTASACCRTTHGVGAG